jgi:hypothetical protein
MKYKNFFTALFPSLIDADGYYQMQKEMNFKAVENTMFNVFAGKETFRAVVLPEALNSTTNSFNREKSLRVRPLDLHDFILPEPCAGKDIQETRKIIAMHPIAYPDNTIPKGGDNETADSGIMSGQIVECYFESGPDSGGSMRGLRYRLTKQIAQNLIDLDCLGSTNLRDLFDGDFKELGADTEKEGSISPGKATSGPDLNWDQLKKLASTGAFNDILAEIAEYESGGSYDALNLDGGMKNFKPYDQVVRQAWGKKLSELTIHEIITYVQKQPKIQNKQRTSPGYRAFAVGKYQLIPGTLRSAFKNIKGCDSNEVYGKEQQEAFGLYLLLNKRPKLGQYLLGSKNVSLATAQTRMAMEWAGVRLSANTHRPKDPKGRWEAADLKAGQSYYSGVSTNPTNIDTGKANKTKTALQKARQSISTNEEIKKTLNKKK